MGALFFVYSRAMSDKERLQILSLETKINSLISDNQKLRKEVRRLTMLLNGEDIIKNSLRDHNKS